MVLRKKIDAVVIGTSTGGPKALNVIIPSLPLDLGIPVFVVQHMPVGMTKDFAQRLNSRSVLKVVEARDNEIIEKNTVYVAPGGFHMNIGKDKKIHLDDSPTLWGVRPAVDKLFISASEVYKESLLAVILTGMGKDGADGIVKIKEKGGITIAQDEGSSVIYGMPKAAFETGKVDKVLPLNSISSSIIEICNSSRRQ